MSLLLQPARLPEEGPSRYRFRLAAANMMSVRQLTELEQAGVLDERGGLFSQAESGVDLNGLGIWVRRWCRFCPACVALDHPWHLSWELLFADACARCGHWLVDRCGHCQARLDWFRAELHRCNCGQRLAVEASQRAPLAVVRLSRALANIAMGEPPLDVVILSGLRLDQCIRLVRLLGAYGTGDGRSAPQKVADIDQLSVSWLISSYAAEVLCSWPDGMTTLLDKLKKVGCDEDTGRLGKAFGGFYTALYKSFGEPGFAFVREAFAEYVVEQWTGPVGRRNRRFDARLLDSVAWIPASHACRELQISRRRLVQLIDDRRLQGARRVSSTGREFLAVRKADVIENAAALVRGFTLSDAATRLGLKRQRLLALLPVICPSAEKVGALGCPWSIPPRWVAYWEQLLQAQRQESGEHQGCVSLDHVLRYWPWTNDQVGHLLLDISGGRLAPRGVLADRKGIGALLLGIDEARQWFADRQEVQEGEITVPNVAVKLEVKQEVIYALVRAGLLAAVARRVGRRAEWRVPRIALERFQERYVFGRDVAAKLNRSPRAVAAFLASGGVAPVAGPGVDSCRQLVFLRCAVDECLHRIAGDQPTWTGARIPDRAGERQP